MSYSRWGSSRWYTFWCAGASGEEEDGDNALFSVDCAHHFRAEELRDSLEDCLDQVQVDN